MRTFLLAGVLLLSATASAAVVESEDILVVKPKPGRDVVKPMKPDWCGAYKPDEDRHRAERQIGHVNTNVRDSLRSLSDDHDRVVREWGFEDFQQTVAHYACEFADDANVQKDVAGMRQMSVNYSGLSEKEDRDSYRVLFTEWDTKSKKQQDENLEKYKDWGGDSDDVDTGTRYIHDLFKQLFFQKNALVTKLTYQPSLIEFFLDTPGRPTGAIERVAYVWTCLHKNSDERVFVPNCGADARRIDVKAADAEAAKLGWNDLARLRVHLYAASARARYNDAYAAYLEDDKRAGEKFGFKKYGVDHPEEAWTRWEKEFYPAHKELYDRVGAVESAYWKKRYRREVLEKGEIKDCDFIRDEYVKAATPMKPKNIDDYNDRVAADPWIEYLLEHAAVCDLSAHRFIDASTWLQLQFDGHAVPARGPRYAMHIQSYLDAQEQSKNGITAPRPRDFRDELYTELKDHERSLEDQYPNPWKECDTHDCYRPEGRVQAVKKDADGGMTVTFKKEKIWQLEQVCHPSSTVRRIMSDGKPEYEQDCRAGNWTQITLETAPVRAYPIDAPFIKPGQFVRFWTVAEGIRNGRKGLFGFPLEVRQPSTQKGQEDKPIMYALVPLAGGKASSATANAGGKKKKK